MPFVSTPTPGEGQWHPIGRTVDGVPTMYAAFIRPNAVYTSLVTGVAWMDTKLLSAQLNAGTTYPGTGQTFANMAPIAGAAPLDAGRRLQLGLPHAGLPGRLLPRRHHRGTAEDRGRLGGHRLVGQHQHRRLGHRRGDDAVHRRRAPEPRPDRGQRGAGAGPQPNDNYRWGATLGGKVQVWRSGLGVTATGALVYVAGNDLSIVDLANVLARAGAVRAMELDINTAWVNFTHFDLNPGVPATEDNGVRLTYDEETSPSRYFYPLSRDFFTMSVRPYQVPEATSHFRSS